jgi:hypothetical protein
MLDTFDLTVDNEDHLFVLENGLVVENSGGVAGSDDKSVRGFEELNQFLQVPENFRDKAILTEKAGIVEYVKPASTGIGNVVGVAGKEYYVPANRKVTVKTGDRMEEGDLLSDGTPNPAEIVRHKGIGEGRRFFVDKYMELLRKNGTELHRRNIEAVARGFINRVRITDPEGYAGYVVDDVVPYDDMASVYEPRDDAKEVPLREAPGRYLEKPYLHYSVGTKVTPAVTRFLEERGVSRALVNEKPPPFEPEVVKAKDILATDSDWMVRMSGENLMKSTLEAARMGATSDFAGTSYYPAAAAGEPLGRRTYERKR